MIASQAVKPTSMSGAARLPIVAPVAIISFFFAGALDYALPLYFSALSEAAAEQGGFYPADLWSKLVKYQVTPWIVGPIVAGLFARRYGERLVWSGALLGQVAVPVALALSPAPGVIPLVALWQGITGALMWIAGISLVQMVASEKKGLANGLMMTAVGLGSVFGPLGARLILYRRELLSLLDEAGAGKAILRLLGITAIEMKPHVSDFHLIYWTLALSTVFCGLLVGIWGQHPGRFEHEASPDWNRTLRDVGRLARLPRFWALVIPLCLLGGPVFQSSNQFLPYRAEDLGLKSGAQDVGWIWLQLLKTLMWLPGGIAVGWLAGRRATGLAAVIMVGSFSLAALGIGLSAVAWQLFACVAVFEFVRQFMRWSHAGYLSEHLPGNLRATAIGFAITFSGLGSTIYGWVSDARWDPTTESALPFFTAATLGGLGSLILFTFDRLHPIREPAPPISDRQQSADVAAAGLQGESPT